MRYLEQIQRGVEYVEQHLDEHFELRAVSKAAGISHAHFQRIFKALTGETLGTYVRARRMASALDALLSTDRRVLDIAIAAGFESQEAFARAFKRAFGMTPSGYRKLGHGNLFLRKLRLDERYIQHLETSVSPTPSFEDRQHTTTIGLPTVFYGAGSEKNNLADKLPPLWDAFLARTNELEGAMGLPYYGIIHPDLEDPERLRYHAAAPVRVGTIAPSAMVRVEIPAGRYAVFEHRGPTETLDTTVDYIYGSWLPSAGVRHTWGADLEIYGAQWTADGRNSIMHYAIPLTA